MTSSIELLPTELRSTILSYCNVNDFTFLATTCKLFLRTMNTCLFWLQIYKNLGINHVHPTIPYHIPVLNYLQGWDPKYKSDFISISDDGKSVTRSSSGSNSSVLGKTPLKNNMSTVFKVVKVGHWLSLGLATREFELEDGSVVGNQISNCFGIYWHGVVTYICGTLPLNCSESKEQYIDTKFSIIFQCQDTIKIIRKESEIYAYHNDKLIYTIKNVPNLTLYPRASLSAHSEVELVK